jgi:hypothetical protein
MERVAVNKAILSFLAIFELCFEGKLYIGIKNKQVYFVLPPSCITFASQKN